MDGVAPDLSILAVVPEEDSRSISPAGFYDRRARLAPIVDPGGWKAGGSRLPENRPWGRIDVWFSPSRCRRSPAGFRSWRRRLWGPESQEILPETGGADDARVGRGASGRSEW